VNVTTHHSYDKLNTTPGHGNTTRLSWTSCHQTAAWLADADCAVTPSRLCWTES